MERGKQHWVPSSYLEEWCDPECPSGYTPYLWRFLKGESTGQRKAPSTIFRETDFYTINGPQGERDLSLENWLGTMENRFRHIRDGTIAHSEPLEAEEKVWFCAFVAAMHFRTRAQRDALQQQWGHALEIMEDLKQVFERMTPEERRNQRRIEPLGGTTGESLSMAEVQRLADKPIQRMLPSIVRQDLPVLSRMNLTIFTTDDDIGFVTSDNPCAWLDPERPRKPPSRSCPGPKTYLAIRPRLPSRTAATTRQGQSAAPFFRADEKDRGVRCRPSFRTATCAATATVS
jgi:hypothetical protein